MWKRFQGLLVLVFLSRRRNLFVENYNINRMAPAGQPCVFLHFSNLQAAPLAQGLH